MLWFDGSIPEAINAAKQRGCVFVVVITGEDEQSAQLMSSWEDDKVSEAAQGCCVAIRVNAKSETCVQFSQFYPVVCIPSSFFIGVNGIPLEVIAGSVSADELMKRIRRVKQMHVEGGSASSEESVYADSKTQGNKATEPAAAFPVRSAATEPAAAPETGRASLYSRGNDDSTLAPVTLAENASSSYSTQGDGNPEVKVESHRPYRVTSDPCPRLKFPKIDLSALELEEWRKVADLMDHTIFGRLTKKQEERLEQKKTGEEESEIKKEMERRKLGKDMHDFKRKQEDEQTKRLLEERNREKAEEKAARERVMQQIAMDRAERAVRYAKTQEEEKSARLAQLQARQVEQDVKRETLLRERNTKARIQFRLPDGSSFTNQFPSQSRLQEAHTFAAQEVGNRYSNFSLATMFPRREFTDEDMNKTLLELELAPSASLVLLPQSSRSANAVVQSSETGIWAVLGTILYPLLAVWKFLSSFLFATPPPQGPAPSGPAQQSSSYNNSGKRETLSKHTVEKQPKDFKKDGKICRFRNQEDSEEDNNTWNGNSTQQM